MEATSYRSTEINLLIASLSKAQGSYKPLNPSQNAPGGKYANLNDILLATRESLSINGLGFYQYIQLLDEGSGASLLHTVLAHESGQYISSCARVIASATDRQTGNRMEYFKRQHAYLILGIAPASNDPLLFDDDGIQQAEEQILQEIRKPGKITHEDIERITTQQYNALMYELEGYPEIAKGIQQIFSIASIADLPAVDYARTLEKILSLKKRSAPVRK